LRLQSCLESSAWDVSAAYDALRRKGLAAAAKKASRHAAEGLVGVAQVQHRCLLQEDAAQHLGPRQKAMRTESWGLHHMACPARDAEGVLG
jgi:hypothetical protein